MTTRNAFMSKSGISSKVAFNLETHDAGFMNKSIFETLSPKDGFITRNNMTKSKNPFFNTQKGFNSHNIEDYKNQILIDSDAESDL